MDKFILIPDSFKGTLSSNTVCDIMATQIKKHYPNSDIYAIPVADGGEGSVNCFLTALGGREVNLVVNGPYLTPIDSFYGILADGKTAVIEMSAAAGLPMVEDNKNPALTSTYGVGELIMHALNKGVKKIIMGLGGSCTNDFGCGCASACGVKFFDNSGKEFIPTGGTLKDIAKIDLSNLDSRLESVEIITMCDIDNPPFGERGAARVFAPQKGADEQMVEMLDQGVKHVCSIVKDQLGVNLDQVKGGGAAGAMGAGMVAFFNSKLKMGIEVVLDTVKFDYIAKDAKAVFTGEGKLDSQSLGGKVVIGVSRRAKALEVPVIAVVGGADAELEKAYEQGVSAVFTINRLPQDLSISKSQSDVNLAFTMDNILRTLKL
ncbi:MAG: glycerate kinase [Clostridia bacterium]|nr:glycerate kinase [Clostridia bacterium]